MSVDFDRMAAHLPADQRKQLSRQYRHGAKHDTAAFLYGFFLGTFGVHHFYLGEWARGFAHLVIPVVLALVILAGVAFGLPSLPIAILVTVLVIAAVIWEIVDLFRIDETVHRRNLALAESLVGEGALADSSTLSDAVARLDSAVVAGAAAGVASNAAIGSISADDLSAARDLADTHSGALMEEFDSTTTKYISDDPNATSPGAPGSWSETMTTAEAAAGTAASAMASNAGDTLDMPMPEYVTHTHTETEDSVTDSYEFARSADSPDATQPMPSPATADDPDATWPSRPAAEAGLAVAGAAGAAALVGDVTDHHAVVPQVHPIGDVENAGDTAPYVSLPEGAPAPAPTVADDAFSYVPPVPTSYPAPEEEEEAYSPLMVDTSTSQRDSTDAHPHVHHGGLVADVEANPSQPVYVTLPEGGFAPTDESGVSAGDAALAGLAGAGLAAGVVGAGLVGETTPEAAPTSGPLMKRIRMKRQIVVDGKVVREEIVEKLVPVDTDTSSMVAEMDTQLGHASKEEIAHMANLDPNESLELRHRMNTEQSGGGE